jgi:hypothetical protein
VAEGQEGQDGAGKKVGDRIFVCWPLNGRSRSGVVKEVDGAHWALVQSDSDSDSGGEPYWAVLVDGQWQCRAMAGAPGGVAVASSSSSITSLQRNSSVQVGKSKQDGSSKRSQPPLRPHQLDSPTDVVSSAREERKLLALAGLFERLEAKSPSAALAKTVVHSSPVPAADVPPKAPVPKAAETVGRGEGPKVPKSQSARSSTDAFTTTANASRKKVGDRISVYWPLDSSSYPGVVTEVDGNAWLLVKYDDGGAEIWSELVAGQWQCRWLYDKHTDGAKRHRGSEGPVAGTVDPPDATNAPTHAGKISLKGGAKSDGAVPAAKKAKPEGQAARAKPAPPSKAASDDGTVIKEVIPGTSGWMVVAKRRINGKSAGHFDLYWQPPPSGTLKGLRPKYRSRAEMTEDGVGEAVVERIGLHSVDVRRRLSDD